MDIVREIRWVALIVLAHAVVMAQAIRPMEYVENVEGFPGWKGELPIVSPDSESGQLLPADIQKPPRKVFQVARDGVWSGTTEVVSWTPRAFLLKDFLTKEECEHIMKNAKPRMTKSTVVDNETGRSVDSEIRTSTGMFFSKGEDDVIRRIEKRLAVASNLPEENGEAIQVLHYQDGQKYEPHNDYFFDEYNQRPENGGQRVATVLMYLSTPEEGGETVFPMAEKKSEGPEWSECAKRGLAVKARQGDALLFFGLTPDGALDPKSLHGSCPTLKGEKWSATKWIHLGQFGMGGGGYARRPRNNSDEGSPYCAEWASIGECKKNPDFMWETCKKSCEKYKDIA